MRNEERGIEKSNSAFLIPNFAERETGFEPATLSLEG